VTGSLDFDCRTAQASMQADKLMILQHIVDNYIAVKREEQLAAKRMGQPGGIPRSAKMLDLGTVSGGNLADLIGLTSADLLLSSTETDAVREEAYDNFNSHVRALLRRSLVSFSHTVLHDDEVESSTHSKQIDKGKLPRGNFTSPRRAMRIAPHSD